MDDEATRYVGDQDAPESDPERAEDEEPTRIASPDDLLSAGNSDSIPTELMTPRSDGSHPSGETPSRTPGGQTDPIVRSGRFGKYEIIGKIGAGGFGKVYLGRDPVLGRDVAVKTCTSEDEGLRRRFLREAKIAAGLQHPNIVTVYDFGYEGETPFMVQEYLSGEDLSQKIEREGLPLEERIKYLLKIAEGMAYAHQHGVLHRDIKPANIRVSEDGQVRILDFGIARLLNETTAFTTDGTTLGTAGYLAPEILGSDEIDERSDIFSFGVLAYELLSYRRPFVGDSFVRISYRLLNERHPPLAERVPGSSPALIRIVDTCLEKHPSDRYASFPEVIREMASLMEDSQSVAVGSGALPTSAGHSEAVPSAPTQPVDRAETRRRPGVWAFGVLGLILLATGVGLGPRLWQSESPPSREALLADSQLPAEQATEVDEVLGQPAQSSEEPTSESPDPSRDFTGQPAMPIEAPANGRANPREDSSPPPTPSASRAEPKDGRSNVRPSEEPSTAIADQPRELMEEPEDVPATAPPTESAEPSPLSPNVESPAVQPPSETPESSSAEAATPVGGAPAAKATEPEPEGRAPNASEASAVDPPPLTPVPLAKVLPELIEQVQPTYPARARRRRLEASVVVGVRVDLDGSVVRTLLKSSSAKGFGFEEAALEAARQSRFRPGTVDGRPATMWAELAFHFKLSG